ncbi:MULTISPECIES: hypothetical protein [Yersinia]|uniref:Uncharacterized protein n=1 Tax=Yersinia frederiksenii TaxID=29484 RepID=A0AAI8ZSM1_YERFR|nr:MULTISPECIES: hypothetical protein [Yersinia]MDN0128114.1 hypothetical protein [Yersinia massiliensis]CFR06566.1 Uncharacterised protein [Yersinia frederiksenii]
MAKGQTPNGPCTQSERVILSLYQDSPKATSRQKGESTSRYADFILLKKKFQITFFRNFVLCDTSQVPASSLSHYQKTQSPYAMRPSYCNFSSFYLKQTANVKKANRQNSFFIGLTNL